MGEFKEYGKPVKNQGGRPEGLDIRDEMDSIDWSDWKQIFEFYKAGKNVKIHNPFDDAALIFMNNHTELYREYPNKGVRKYPDGTVETIDCMPRKEYEPVSTRSLMQVFKDFIKNK